MESAARKPFIEHVQELRKRVLGCVVALGAFSAAGYLIQDQLLAAIQKPLGQTLFYTSPGGGFSFIFKLCVLFGLICALPVITFHLLTFIKPLFSTLTRRALATYLTWSVMLALFGIAFAYVVSLPAALHFFTNFGGDSIQALITAEAYFNFALAYLAGFAVLFQLPLIILFINRIKPQQPRQLMRMQRYVILGSFIVAAILTPTPDPANQLLMALPVIVLYQFSVLLVWLVNSRNRSIARYASIPIPQETAVLKNVSGVAAVEPSLSAAPGVRRSPRKPISDFVYSPRPVQSSVMVGTSST